MQLDLKIVKHLDIFTIMFLIFKICIKWKFNKIERRERNEKNNISAIAVIREFIIF